MTVNSKIFSVSTLNTVKYGRLTPNIKPHLDPLQLTLINNQHLVATNSHLWVV